MTKIIPGTALGFVLTLSLFWLLRALAPYPLIPSEDYALVQVEAARTHLSQAPEDPSPIYIKSDLKPLAAQLQLRFEHRKILPWSQRPGCDDTEGNPHALCGRADYLSIDSVIFPLWRTAIVNLSAFNSGTQLVLIKIGSSWRVVSSQGFVI